MIQVVQPVHTFYLTSQYEIFKPITLFTVAAILLFSCKKDSQPANPEPSSPVPEENKLMLKDSVSFTTNGNNYVFSEIWNKGVGNFAVNVKPYKAVSNTGKLAYETGGYYWYGEPDSTLYSLFFDMRSDNSANGLHISFNKKFKDSDLQKGQSLRKLMNDKSMFEPGKLTYAVDLEKENTLEGVCIDVGGEHFNSNASTRIPGFSIIVRSDLDNNIQNNSTFEITDLKHIHDDIYIIEARFEANLYDEKENAYRLKNGFMRVRANMVNFLSPFFF